MRTFEELRQAKLTDSKVEKIFFDTFTTGTARLRVFELDHTAPEKQALDTLKTRAPMARGFTRLAIGTSADYSNGSVTYVEVEFFTARPN